MIINKIKNQRDIDLIKLIDGSLISITIPDSVTSIGNYTFRMYETLTLVTIPNSVTSIGNEVFYGCTSLSSITIWATVPPTLGTNVFLGCSTLEAIYVPFGSLDAYKTATNWSAYANLMQEMGLRNIIVGDNLSGKKLYFNFPNNLYQSINTEENFISMSNGVNISTSFVSMTYLGKVVWCYELYSSPFYGYNEDTSTLDSNLSYYNTSSEWGIVTSIKTSNPAYQYIKIQDI